MSLRKVRRLWRSGYPPTRQCSRWWWWSRSRWTPWWRVSGRTLNGNLRERERQSLYQLSHFRYWVLPTSWADSRSNIALTFSFPAIVARTSLQMSLRRLRTRCLKRQRRIWMSKAQATIVLRSHGKRNGCLSGCVVTLQVFLFLAWVWIFRFNSRLLAKGQKGEGFAYFGLF